VVYYGCLLICILYIKIKKIEYLPLKGGFIMFKKLIAVSLVAAMALPVSAAFASDEPSDVPGTQSAVESSPTVAPGSDLITIMSTTWSVTTPANLRATPSPTGALVASLYPGEQLTGSHNYVVVNGVTWVPVTCYRLGVSGYILLSALEEVG
jgi:hypothetical protein